MPKLGGSRMPSVPPAASDPDELRQGDAPDRRRRGDARSADRGEDGATDDVGLEEAARQARDELREARIDAGRQPADAQDLRHQHE
jgi:hypothetical protein